jgi:hypothetical protein
MKIYEYRKHLVAGEIRDPEFIINGGHWYDSATDTYISVMPDSVSWYIPDTIEELTSQDLINRIKVIHSHTPYNKRVGVLGSGGYIDESTTMSDTDVVNFVNDWLTNITLNS